MRTFLMALAVLLAIPAVSWAQTNKPVCMTLDCALAAQQAGTPHKKRTVPSVNVERLIDAAMEVSCDKVVAKEGNLYYAYDARSAKECKFHSPPDE